MKPIFRTLGSLALLSSSAFAENQNADPNISPARSIIVQLERGKEKEIKIPKGVDLAKNGTMTLGPGDQVHLESVPEVIWICLPDTSSYRTQFMAEDLNTHAWDR